MIELRQLYYFEAVARELHFARAAAALGVTPSTLSHGIRRLEAELGAPLFVRTSRRVALTDTGRQLVTALPSALRRLEAVLEDARAVGHAWEH
jgi:DNA-binding transcriptional LysR family regulator